MCERFGIDKLKRRIVYLQSSTLIILIQIWAGSKEGKLSLFDTITFECEKSFEAHTDTIRSLCYVENNK